MHKEEYKNPESCVEESTCVGTFDFADDLQCIEVCESSSENYVNQSSFVSKPKKGVLKKVHSILTRLFTAKLQS